MSSTAQSAGLAPYLVFVVIILFILFRVVRRTLANYRGTVFSLSKAIAYSAVYVALGVGFSALSFFEGVPYVIAVPEVLIAAVAAFGSYRYTDKRISFWKPSDGPLYFRGGIVIYLIYIVGLVTRLAIDVVFIGPSLFSFASTIQLTGAALYGSMATDILLIFGVGLLMGRNVRVVRRYGKLQRGEEPIPTTPPSRESGKGVPKIASP